MAYSEELADRVRDLIFERPEVSERKMFGGVAWMVSGNMAVGVMEDRLMVRLPHEEAERALAESHAGPMDFTGKKMRGFVVVESQGVESDEQLERWVEAGSEFASALPPK